MALTKTTKKTSSIIKTRSQSRTGKNDDTIAPAPAPVAVATGGGRTTGTTNDPVATTTNVAPAPADLFAGRPTTGTLKDSPPVPTTGMNPVARDRDSDSSDDDAKKPAAKPKPKPKKVAPTKATRKPRKPRKQDPADDLVDPMANIHVGDATGVVTAGGIARAGGHDPVLANPEQLEPEQPEPQPKKKTRHYSRISRAPRRPR